MILRVKWISDNLSKFISKIHLHYKMVNNNIFVYSLKNHSKSQIGLHF
ncbi:hypothetical protein FEDK69T_17800 [Flavobacterium enshiense DK69]|nr:hypothetical protein FEDK69T_17800 [Flavobacterium enshiense DK69]